MSTFGGRFHEPGLDWISVDNFTEINLTSDAFFLSHLHTDHMRGLNSSFFDSLVSTNRYLYCSEVTEAFLRKKIIECFSNKNIIHLSWDSPTLIAVPNKSPVEVTIVSAGHCPGSVMFIFETHDTRVLYTGDFRLPICDLPKFRALHNSDGEVKKFDAIYLDTTFAFPNYKTFPSREQSKNELIKIVKDWLKPGTNNKIGIVPPAHYGLEFLVLELAKAMKQKIHIKNNILFENYKCICELSDYITCDSNSANIHLCQQSSYPYLCEICNKEESVIKRIRPSAMKFTQKHLQSLKSDHNVGIVDESQKIIGIAYSSHCSLDELKGFLKYVLRDGCKVYPCVIQSGLEKSEYLRNLGIQQPKKQTPSERGNDEVLSQIKRQKCEDNSSEHLVGKQDSNLLIEKEASHVVQPEPATQHKDLVETVKELFGLHSPPQTRRFQRFN